MNENIKKLIGFLDQLCKAQQDDFGCEVCPNYAECSAEIWEQAESELELLGIDVMLTT
jgi:hypothetical protein